MFDSEYHIFEDIASFDEKGSTCGTFRRVQWVKSGEEPDIAKAKLELRKIYVNGEGEKPGKGYTFSTEEGPSELTLALINSGFGGTKDILRAVRKREDFLESAKTINEDDDDSTNGEMFDMRDLLMGMDEEDLEDAG